MEEWETDLLEEYIAQGNTKARTKAHLDELCAVVDEIRALYPPPPRAELMEQTVDRIAGSLSAQQGVRRFYRRWFVRTGWASAAVAAVLLVSMGVLPHRSGDYLSIPVPLTGENASLDFQQPAVLSHQTVLPMAPVQSPVATPPGQTVPGAMAEKTSASQAGEGAAVQQKVAQTLPNGNPPPAPAVNAMRAESAKDSAKRPDRPPEVFKNLNFMVPDKKFAAAEDGSPPVRQGALNATSALAGKSEADRQQAVPFKLLTVPDQTPLRTEISNDDPPGVTMVYHAGKAEIVVRQWLRTATEPLGPAADAEVNVLRLYRGDVAVEVSGAADLAELKRFAENLQ